MAVDRAAGWISRHLLRQDLGSRINNICAARKPLGARHYPSATNDNQSHQVWWGHVSKCLRYGRGSFVQDLSKMGGCAKSYFRFRRVDARDPTVYRLFLRERRWT